MSLVLATAILLAIAGGSRAGDEDSKKADLNWYTDLAKAQDVARKEGKPVFLMFTGTKWCGVCQELEKNILSKPEFAKFVKDRVILVREEYKTPYFHEDPKTTHTAEQQAQIDLAKRYDVNVGQPNVHGLHGFPSVFLVAPDGTELREVNTNIIVAQGDVGSFLKSFDKDLSAAEQKMKTPATQPADKKS
jgi:protein disulfide-isomerase